MTGSDIALIITALGVVAVNIILAVRNSKKVDAVKEELVALPEKVTSSVVKVIKEKLP